MHSSWDAESNQKAIRDSIYRNDANLDSPDRYFNKDFSESDQFKDWMMELGFTHWVNANISDIVDAFAKEVGNIRYDQGIEWEHAGQIRMENVNAIDFLLASCISKSSISLSETLPSSKIFLHFL